MTASLRSACDAVGAPLGLVLEGGYDLGALAGSMAALMPVLVAEGAVDAGAVARHPLADAADNVWCSYVPARAGATSTRRSRSVRIRSERMPHVGGYARNLAPPGTSTAALKGGAGGGWTTFVHYA